MATTNLKKPKPAGDASRGLQIVSRPAAFYRCGRMFTATPTTLSLADLSDDEVERLKAEPLLVVTEVDIKPADATA